MLTYIRMLNREEGHAMILPAPLVAGVGAILLAIGAANDSGVLAIIGGIVIAVGLMASSILSHTSVDYDVYGRLEELEKK